ncbi:MAG: Xaa-Pro peptidase family protein [Bacteroidales bacterium]
MKEEFSKRINKIRKHMSDNNVDACMISTTVNMLYAYGHVVIGYYYIPLEGETVLFTKKAATKEGISIRKPEQIPDLLLDMNIAMPNTMYVEGDVMGHSYWLRLQKCFPDTKFIEASLALRTIRSVKTDYEVSLIKQSARLQVEVYQSIPDLFKPGMNDDELAHEIEYALRKHGHLGVHRTFGQLEIFMGSLLVGKNAGLASPYDFALGGAGDSDTIPIGANGTKIEKGNTIMVDYNGNATGYMNDCTRTFSYGILPQKAYDAHKLSIEILQLFESYPAGNVCEDFYLKTLQIVEKAGLSDCFMGSVRQAPFVGHGVGLEVNEFPVLAKRFKTILEPNMVVAVEPKFIIEGVGAVGAEDTFIIGETNNVATVDLNRQIIKLD